MRIQLEVNHLHCMLVAEIGVGKEKSCEVEASYVVYPIVTRLNNKTNATVEYIPMIPIMRRDDVTMTPSPQSAGVCYCREIVWLSEMLQTYEPINDTIEFPQSHSIGYVHGIKGPEKSIQWYTNTSTLTIVHGSKEHAYEIPTNGLKMATAIIYNKKTGEEIRMFRKDKWWSEIAKTIPTKK